MSFLPMRSHGLTEKEMQAFQPVHDAAGVPCYLDIAILQCRHMRLVIQNADLSDHHARVGQSTIRHTSDVPQDLLKTPETRPMMDPYCLVEHQGQIRKSKVMMTRKLSLNIPRLPSRILPLCLAPFALSHSLPPRTMK
jgi:hypothetical protein